MLGPRFDLMHGDQPSPPLGKIELQALAELKRQIDSGNLTFEYHDCPICGGQDMETLATRDRYGVACTTMICNTCALIQTQPYLDSESLVRFYNEIFPRLHRGTDGPTKEKFENRRKYGQKLADWFDDLGIANQGVIVDIGCGSGGIVQGFLDKGRRAVGIELSSEYVEYGNRQGLDLRCGHLSEGAIPQDATLISYIQVLEHVFDLRSELELLARVLPKDAKVFVEVPSVTSVPSQYHYDFLHLLQLAHVWIFSPQSLSALFRKYGFVAAYIDDYVRAVFSYDPQRAGEIDVPFESREAVKRRISQYERIRPFYWRRWARIIKAGIKARI